MRQSSLLTAALSLLGCAAIAATPSAVAAPSHTRAACHTVVAHAARRSRAVRGAHACPVHTRRAAAHKTIRPKLAQHPAPAPPPPAASPAVDGLAATIAAVLATPCQNTELEPDAANLAPVRAAVLCLINQKRAQNGEQPLALDPQLQEAAEGHSQELISLDYFAHVAPSGETPVDRIRETGYIPNSSVGYVIGENLAWGTYGLATPQAIVSAWIASPGHLANILEAKYTQTGIAVVPEVPASLSGGAPGATYAQEFGVIIP